MKTSNLFIARQCDQAGECVELEQCIASGQVSAAQIEAHYAAGDIAQPKQTAAVQGAPVAWRDVTDTELDSIVAHWGTDARQACLDLAAVIKHKNPSHYTTPQPAQGDAKDAERLDFLISNRAYVVSDKTCTDGYWLHYIVTNVGTLVQASEHTTPREAIDAAIASQKGGQS